MSYYTKGKALKGAEHDQFVLGNPCPRCEYTPLLASVGIASDEQYGPQVVDWDIIQVQGPTYICYECGWSVRARHPETWMREFFRLGD